MWLRTQRGPASTLPALYGGRDPVARKACTGFDRNRTLLRHLYQVNIEADGTIICLWMNSRRTHLWLCAIPKWCDCGTGQVPGAAVSYLHGNAIPSSECGCAIRLCYRVAV